MLVLLNFLLGIAVAVPPFALAIMLHEGAHALAAHWLGDPTAKNTGRISLDPRRHFDPFGALIFLITMAFRQLTGHGVAIGWAKPVPINPYNFRDARRDFMLSSLAGPASNVAQAFLWAVAMGAYAAAIGIPPFYLWDAPVLRNPIAYMISFGIVINLILLAFNLLPIPPLDGSRVLAWALPERYAHYVDRMERYGLLIVLGLLFFLPQVLGIWFGIVYAPLMNLCFKVAYAIF